MRAAAFRAVAAPFPTLHSQEEMASSMKNLEACNSLKSINLEGGVLGSTIMSTSSTGRFERDHPFQYSLGLQHYGQPVSHHLQGSASWSNPKHLCENQASNANAVDYHSTVAPAVLFSKAKASGTSDDDTSSWKEASDEQLCDKGKRTSCWHRIKWTNDMVKLLINVVNYVGEDGADNLDMNRGSVLQRKGKWRSVSNVMNERGWYVSPQQCEDKFNDLNKRYKRLTDILGRDTALRVVDDITLLDSMHHLTAKRISDVKKILSSKHSFYKEMHSYHKGCISPAATDVEFQSVIKFANVGERSDAGYGTAKADTGADGCDIDRATSFVCQKEREQGSTLETDNKEAAKGHLWNLAPNRGLDVGGIGKEANPSVQQQLSMLGYRLMQLEKLKVSLQAQALEVEQQRFRWQKLHCKKNRELDKMREDNKRMKFENSQLTNLLKQRELEVECKRSVTSMALFDLLLEKLKSKEQTQCLQGQGYG